MTAQAIQTPRKRPTKLPDKVDKQKAIELKLQGYSYKKIAQEMSCHPSSVHQAIKHLIPTSKTEIFKKYRADIFSEMQRRLLGSISDLDIKKAPMGARVLAAAQIYDKERLERNLSTSNTASIRADIAALKGLTRDAKQQSKASTRTKKQSTNEIKQIEEKT